MLSSEQEDSSTLMEVPDEVEPEEDNLDINNNLQHHKDFTDVEIATNQNSGIGNKKMA